MKSRLFGRTQSEMDLMERMKQATEYNRSQMLHYYKTNEEIKKSALNKDMKEQPIPRRLSK